jgi:hypothetical protein
MSPMVQRASIAVILCGLFVKFAAAQEAAVPQSIYPLHALTCPDALLRGCCNIYCPKPTPCIKPFCHGCCKDCYCSKPFPCTPCYCRAGTSYCYCNKPCPDLCRPIASDYFTCVEKSAGCTPSGAVEPNGHLQPAHSHGGDSIYEITEIPPAPPLLNYSN